MFYEEAEVACTFFAYANKPLINKLIKRGDCITNGKISKLIREEARLQDMIDEKAEDFKRPVKAFLIFKDQEGFERCAKYVSTTKNIIG